MARVFSKKEKTNLQETPTFISEDCIIHGDIKAGAVLRVEGSVIGNIPHAKNIIIGEHGSVEGNIHTGEIIIFGRIRGNVTADRITIKSSGEVSGELTTKKLHIDNGAVYNGTMKMETAAEETYIKSLKQEQPA